MRKGFAICSYLLFGILTLSYIILELTPTYSMGVIFRLTATLSACVFLYLGSWLLAKGLESEQQKYLMKHTFRLMFAVYLVLLLTFTLFDPLLGRSISLNKWTFPAMFAWFGKTTNLVPFRMINIYLQGYQEELITLNQLAMNLLGNFILLMPLAYIAPLLNPKLRKFRKFLGFILIFIISIELAQGILMVGYFDVDDLMLNLAGALLVFGFSKIKVIRSLTDKITFEAFS